MKPTGSIAVVTGGSRGIGRAIVLALAARGWPVAFSYRGDAQAAQALAQEVQALGVRALALQADVRAPEQVQAVVAQAEAVLGPIGVLVCNAGIAPVASWEQADLAHWREVLQANLESAFVASQQAVPGMAARGWGRLVFLSSIAARTGGVVSPAYAASKAGLEGLMHYYAARLAGRGVTANAVAPAFIETPMLAGLPVPPAAALPVGRYGQPAEVASVVELLVDNGFVNGQTLHVDGGLYMT